MRRFHSYGPINPEWHYCAPRQELIHKAYVQMVGENFEKGGHFITVWAPRQTGKTSIMGEVLYRVQKDPRFYIVKLNLQNLLDQDNTANIISIIARDIGEGIGKKIPGITTQDAFQAIFKKDILDKPLILILDEFDSLAENAIHIIIAAFRNIYISRLEERDKPTAQKTYLLHAVALIGVRSVLGIENQKGSPFNVQQSLHISNLSFGEVQEMFQAYESETGQKIEPEVIETLFHETRGQPGLTSWFGELLTEGCENYINDKTRAITIGDFRLVYQMAMNVLPNNTIINLVSKARISPYKDIIINLFKTDEPLEFRFDHDAINYLYMNGIIEPGLGPGSLSYVRFASPFIQKRLFNYFSHHFFDELGQLVGIFYTVPQFVFPGRLDIPVILQLYQTYLDKNKSWLFKNAPRRSDLRIYEAVFHFNLYAYLERLLRGESVYVYPEFPTGNGKIDLILQSQDRQLMYGIELKSFSSEARYRQALEQAAGYGQKLGLREMYLVSFVESIDEETLKKYGAPFFEPLSGVTVYPYFLQTGSI